MAKRLRIEHRSIPILYLVLALPLAIAALAQFGILDLTQYVADILTILAATFVLSEVGVMGMLRKRKMSRDPFRIFGALVGVVAIIGAGLSFFGVTVTLLETLKGIVNLLVLIYVVIEAFR